MSNPHKKPNIVAVMTYVTVEMAIEFLKTNVQNRPLTMARVKELAEIMKLDFYITTHQGVAFDVNGILVDGQHRLAAIVESGIPQWIFVFNGLHPDCRKAIDNGKVRTPIAISRIIGRIGDSSQIFAIVKKLQYGVIPGSQLHINESVLFELVDKFSDGLNFLQTCKSWSNMNSVVATVVVRAYYSGVDPLVISRFCEILWGSPTSPPEIAAQKLREFLLVYPKGFQLTDGTATRNKAMVIYNTTETALNAFIHKTELKKLKQTTVEMFKLPKHLNGYNPKT